MLEWRHPWEKRNKDPLASTLSNEQMKGNSCLTPSTIHAEASTDYSIS